MQAKATHKIEATFGWPEFPDGLFYEAKWGLRFDLGGDLTDTAPRFLQAMDRARLITNSAFASSTKLWAVASSYGGERRTRRHHASFQALRALGFRHDFGAPQQVKQGDPSHFREFGEDLCRYWYQAEFSNDPEPLAALLWASVAAEGYVNPKARWIDTIHIADFENGVALTVYDDRGMDVVATEAGPLMGLYERFGGWLLDHDRPAMEAKFGATRRPKAR